MNNFPLHHVGYVVEDIARYANNFPCCEYVRTIYDPLQDADLAIYSLPNALIEFIQPKSESSFTYRFRKNFGSGLHQICYEASSLQDINKAIEKNKMIKIRGPMKAVLFDRDVVFAMTREKALIEFIF